MEITETEKNKIKAFLKGFDEITEKLKTQTGYSISPQEMSGLISNSPDIIKQLTENLNNHLDDELDRTNIQNNLIRLNCKKGLDTLINTLIRDAKKLKPLPEGTQDEIDAIVNLVMPGQLAITTPEKSAKQNTMIDKIIDLIM